MSLTTPTAVDVAQRLDGLAGAIVDHLHQLNSQSDSHRSHDEPQKLREDAAQHLSHLAQAFSASAPSLFKEYIAWAKVTLAGRGIPTESLADQLRAMMAVLREKLDGSEAAAFCEIVEASLADLPAMACSLPCRLAPEQPLGGLAQSYLAALLASNRRQASELIISAADSGTPIKQLYIHVFQQSQIEIGRLWQTNQITVAQEHYCTAATQMIMSQLYPRIFAGPRIGRRFVGACASGDLHEIGMRMVTDFFEMDGWDTDYLGASVPNTDLIQTLVDRKPDVLGISVAIIPHLDEATRLIGAIRENPACARVKILVGGYPFQVVPDLWREIGADGTCADAQGAVDLATKLLLN